MRNIDVAVQLLRLLSVVALVCDLDDTGALEFQAFVPQMLCRRDRAELHHRGSTCVGLEALIVMIYQYLLYRGDKLGSAIEVLLLLEQVGLSLYRLDSTRTGHEKLLVLFLLLL